MTPSEENLKLRERFLTKDLFAHLWSRTGAPKDYFTETENFPKAFRIGTCEAVSPDKTIFQVVLLWRDDEKNVQREAKVEMLRQDGKWLVNKVLDQ